MISSLLKNRGLRLQLLVGLLLVLGAFPGPSEGLKCYSCNTGKGKDNPDCRQTTECDGGCGSYYYPSGTIYKKCESKDAVKCSRRLFESDCVTANNKAETDDLLDKLINCTANPKKEKMERQHTTDRRPFFKSCICTTDLCNGGPESSVECGGGLSSLSILHPFNSIIFAILAVAYYNYI